MRYAVRTWSGQLVDLLDPDPKTIKLVDIAHHLAGQHRWVGGSDVLITTAQHSVISSLVCDPEDALEGLFHDAHEYVLGDLPRGLKRLPELREVWQVIEDRVQRAIAEAFGIRAEMPRSVKVADDRLAITEMRDLFDPPREPSLVIAGLRPLHTRIRVWERREAEVQFLRRYLELRPVERVR